MKRTVAAILLVCISVSHLRANDLSSEIDTNWHQWRGPFATGTAPAADPPIHWDESANVKWKAEIPGEGSSTPIIWGNQIFVLTAVQTDRIDDSVPPASEQPERPFGITFPQNYFRFVVMSIDRQTGNVLWEQTACVKRPHEGHHGDNDFASASPMTDGQRLFVSFGSRGIYCYDLQGNLLWERQLGEVDTRLSFGEGTSIVVHDETVIVNRDNEGQSYIVALDANSGETIWKKDRDESTAWATPLVVEHNNRKQVITSASNRVRSYDFENGDLIWQCGGQVSNVIPSPFTAHGLVYCMSGYRGSALFAIPVDSKGDLTDSDRIAWKLDRDTPYIPSAVLVDDLMYFTKSNSGVLTCVDSRTGENVYGPIRLPGVSKIYSSPVSAGGHVYLTGRDGTTLVVKHGPKFEVLATNRIAEAVDSSLAIAGHDLFIRSEKSIYCISNAAN